MENELKNYEIGYRALSTRALWMTACLFCFVIYALGVWFILT